MDWQARQAAAQPSAQAGSTEADDADRRRWAFLRRVVEGGRAGLPDHMRARAHAASVRRPTIAIRNSLLGPRGIAFELWVLRIHVRGKRSRFAADSFAINIH